MPDGTLKTAHASVKAMLCEADTPFSSTAIFAALTLKYAEAGELHGYDSDAAEAAWDRFIAARAAHYARTRPAS